MPPIRSRQMLLIRASSGSSSRTQLIDKDEFSFGRSADADVVSAALGVSRVHLLARLKEGRVWIRDQGSSNGSFLQGAPVSAKEDVEWRPGVELTLGDSNDIYLFEAIEAPLELGDLESARAAIRAAAGHDLELLRQATVDEGVREATLEARAALAEIKLACEKNADALMRAAELKAAAAIENGEAEAQRLMREGQRKAAAALAAAETEIDQTLKSARTAASEMRAEAQRDLEAARERARTRANETQALAQEDAEKLVRDARERAQSIVSDQENSLAQAVAALRDDVLTQARKEADSIVAGAQKAKSELIEIQAAMAAAELAARAKISALRAEAMAAAVPPPPPTEDEDRSASRAFATSRRKILLYAGAAGLCAAFAVIASMRSEESGSRASASVDAAVLSPKPETKASYVDELFAERLFTETRLNPALQQAWNRDLAQFMQERFRLDGSAANAFAQSELDLVQKLKDLRSAGGAKDDELLKMRAAEADAHGKLIAIVGGETPSFSCAILKKTSLKS